MTCALAYFNSKLRQVKYCRCIFQVKVAEKNRKNIFREKQTTKKLHVMFLDVKMLTET